MKGLLAKKPKPDEDKENAGTINIKINNGSKPPIPKREALAVKQQNDESDSEEGTPDREQEMRDRLKQQIIQGQGPMKALRERPKSAKPMAKLPVKRIRPRTAKPVAKPHYAPPAQPKTFVRPATAKINYPVLRKKKPGKKTDPVSRYQALQNEWSKSGFLNKNTGSKQGRKLELDRFHKWSSIMHQHNSTMGHKKGQVHKYINQNHAPATDRRDDLRFNLRAKIS